MAQKIIFRYPEMKKAAATIKQCAENYKTAADKFVREMTDATAGWEGASKEKFMQLINDSVHKYLAITIPEVVTGLSEMLDSNAEQMKSADTQIAEAIPSSLS